MSHSVQVAFLGAFSFPVGSGHQSQASLSRTAPRSLALARFQEQICMLRLRPLRPYSPFPTLFPRFFVYYADLDQRFEPGARSPLHGETMCFSSDPLHVCSTLRARVLVGHCGRTLVPEKGQWMSFGFHQPGAALRTARLPAFATLYPNSQTVSVCHSLSQQPDLSLIHI